MEDPEEELKIKKLLEGVFVLMTSGPNEGRHAHLTGIIFRKALMNHFYIQVKNIGIF